MDIYAKKGTKVKFLGCSEGQENWGSTDDHSCLAVGEIYTVDHTEVHSWHTKVYLEEVPGKRFNSVCFE